ncbi:hypothetical protein IEQ34_016379 [Dendrobium chrysotoxum]|uniref:Uncharacterized protein n=1 Tax=Dendrobium chrysotoxum TaxID=161865 RepID=A0AAV7FXI9_DENCH|nr:hypothetical protein IEQ34_016379 [Dendrobium chrysotoxum]
MSGFLSDKVDNVVHACNVLVNNVVHESDMLLTGHVRPSVEAKMLVSEGPLASPSCVPHVDRFMALEACGNINVVVDERLLLGLL